LEYERGEDGVKHQRCMRGNATGIWTFKGRVGFKMAT